MGLSAVPRCIFGLLLLARFSIFINAADEIAVDLGNDLYLSNDGYKFSTSKASVGWQGQFAIGNGKTGALVGGVFEVDIMPITTADLFVIPRDAFKKMRQIFTNSSNIPRNYGEGSVTRDKFNAARTRLMSNDLKGAEGAMWGTLTSKMGMFEYIMDLSFMYNTVPFNQASTQEKGSHKHAHGDARYLGGRGGKIQDLRNLIYGGNENGLSATEVKDSKLFLDTKNAIFNSVFTTFGGGKTLRHDRSWYMSDVDDVMIGKLSCLNLDHNDEKCLNVAINLNRENSAKFTRKTTINSIKDNTVGVTFELGPSDTEQLPHVVGCVLVKCMDGSLRKLKEDSPTIACESASASDVYIGIEKEDTLVGAVNAQRKGSNWYDADIVRALTTRCWDKVTIVAGRDDRTNRNRHSDSFSVKSTRTKLNFGVKDNAVPSSVKSMQGMFQMSRYLMLSAGTKAVSNLQGIWTDGRETNWNGDYHLNINLQMQYWPAFTAGLDEIHGPLISFVRKLRQRGESVARYMYNSRGWVAHGHLDGHFDVGIPSAFYWSGCVTCGAWTALHLWEDFLFTGNLQTLKQELIPAFEGIANFFTDYMVTIHHGDDTLYTGPTGSPETSYFVKGDSDELAFSPAIDLSVLRQSANAYYLAASLLSNGNANDATLIHALAFVNTVKRMIACALPVVSRETGLVLEYPHPFPNAQTHAILFKKDKSITGSLFVDETGDVGHRHYSSMHWLYPGLFLPSKHMKGFDNFVDYYTAAKKTLDEKKKHRGGHTGWSASWEASLYARIGSSNDVWVSLDRIMKQYVTTKYFGLHPPLFPFKTGCDTCYKERDMKNRKIGFAKRGMNAQDQSPFQFDANMGFTAAVCEMLLQSHVPGHLLLLPAIPAQLIAVGGYIKGIRARGLTTVTMSWGSSSDPNVPEIKSLVLHVANPHPWNSYNPGHFHNDQSNIPLPSIYNESHDTSTSDQTFGGLKEHQLGYFRWTKAALGNTKITEIIVTYPLKDPQHHLRLVLSSTSSDSKSTDACATELQSSNKTLNNPVGSFTIRVHKFPCNIKFCIDNNSCDLVL